ncbi:MAG: hypothetical protein LBP38_02070 [Desulfovibrio sp.]|nr:hypothetical protein [Desulfovibrio sp.]
MRDLFRARGDAKKMERAARQNLSSFLLRIGVEYPGRTRWTKMYFRWLRELSLPAVQQLALQEYIDTVEQCRERIARYDGMLQEAAAGWKRAHEVKNLQSLRGISLLTAISFLQTITLGNAGRGRHRFLYRFLGIDRFNHNSFFLPPKR